MKAGVIAVQGAFPEHVRSLERAVANNGRRGSVITVRRLEELEQVSCLIIPGGESTAISKLLSRHGLHDQIVSRAREGMPIMGTCAGCVLLAKEGDDEVHKTGTELLELVDIAVDRNAFGRQRESFEAPLEVKGLDATFPGVFIRAPVINRIWGRCEVLSTHAGRIVMVRQDNLIGLSFHPELSEDTRIHEMLLGLL
jgi:5'-phosphate synthase pdxT subunit